MPHESMDSFAITSKVSGGCFDEKVPQDPFCEKPNYVLIEKTHGLFHQTHIDCFAAKHVVYMRKYLADGIYEKDEGCRSIYGILAFGGYIRRG